MPIEVKELRALRIDFGPAYSHQIKFLFTFVFLIALLEQQPKC